MRRAASAASATPADIANLVRYLVSPQNSYVTGERIYVHGGVH